MKKNPRRRISGVLKRKTSRFYVDCSCSLTRTRSNGRMFGALNSRCIKSQPKRVKSFAFLLASDECNFPLNRSSFVYFNLTQNYGRAEKRKMYEWHKWCWRNLWLKKKIHLIGARRKCFIIASFMHAPDTNLQLHALKIHIFQWFFAFINSRIIFQSSWAMRRPLKF